MSNVGCFALGQRGLCGALIVRDCDGESCAFRKSREEQDASLERTRERLRTVQESDQQHIEGKYYNRGRDW